MSDDSLFCILFVYPLVAIPIAMMALVFLSRTPELCGAGVGSLAVFLIVRWMNRRHDPRHQKRPSDVP